VKIAETFSHRNGLDILESPNFAASFHEFREVLRGLPPYRSAAVKKTSPKHIIDPGSMNRWLDDQLAVRRDWDWHPLIIEVDPEDKTHNSQLRSDFRKDRIEVEVQFGNVARYAYDVYKMAISLALQNADVGLMVVCTKKFSDILGGNIAYYERVVRELERSRLTLIVPLVVLGIEPDNWIAERYPPLSEAPTTIAADINKARKARGQAEVPPHLADDELTLEELRSLAQRVA
jgi:hypothetical protein